MFMLDALASRLAEMMAHCQFQRCLAGVQTNVGSVRFVLQTTLFVNVCLPLRSTNI